MKTKVWLNLDPQKVDVSYLYKKFDEIGCDFEAEAIPDNNPELLIKKVKDVDIVIATMEPWNETTLGAVKGKVKFIQKYGTGVDSVDLKPAGKNGIPVANIPGANAPAVAEVAMMHILNNCASHSRYFSDELDAQIFYQKKERMFTSGTICAKI